MDIKRYLLIQIYRKMFDNFNTSTAVKTFTALGTAFGVSLYLYFRKDDKGGKSLKDVKEVNVDVKSLLHYDLYKKLNNEQKTQKKELLELGDSFRESIERLQNIFSNYTTSINSRLHKLEMKNPECSFFDNKDNVLPHISEKNELLSIDSQIDTPTNTPLDTPLDTPTNTQLDTPIHTLNNTPTGKQ